MEGVGERVGEKAEMILQDPAPCSVCSALSQGPLAGHLGLELL